MILSAKRWLQGKGRAEAELYLQKLQEEERYQRDVWL